MTVMTTTQEPAWALRYPELFAGLSIEQRWSVHNTIANGVLEGWTPEPADIADLTALARGDIDGDEAVRRSDARMAARFGARAQ